MSSHHDEDLVHHPDDISTKGPVAWFAKNHVAANIIMLFLILAGLAAAMGATKETFPSIDPRLITVTVPYPGATPQEIEDAVTRRVEEAVMGLQGIKRVESNASEGVGAVTIELSDFVDGSEVLNEVETEVSRLADFPPENAEEVTVIRAKSKPLVVSMVVYGDLPEVVLRTWAETIREDLIQIEGVSLVDLRGTRNREIAIEIAEETLRKHNLTLGEVADKLKSYSVDIPGGNLRGESDEILLRVQERRFYGKEFDEIIILTKDDGTFVRLGDIATIRDDFEDVKIISSYNGKSAIFIDVKRSDVQDTLQMEGDIQAYISKVELPSSIGLDIWKNETIILKDRINLLSRNAMLGFALVFLSMLLFLDLKLAFWTSLGIPISFLGGFFIASLFGVSINMISLFALIVVLGIVVDDAIVTGESIFSEQENHPEAGLRSSLFGVHAIRAPVTIGVLTTVAAFAPLMFSTGILGQILKPIPVVVMAVLLISLVEAFFILPAHLASPKRWSLGYLYRLRRTVAKGLDFVVLNIVTPVVRTCLQARYITVLVIAAIISIAGYQVKSGALKYIFFPPIESDEVFASLQMPVGTPFEVTERYMREMESAALRAEELLAGKGNLFEKLAFSVGTIAADAGPGGERGGQTASNVGEIQIKLVPSDMRDYSASEIERAWRKQVRDIPQAEKVGFLSSLVRGGADINLELSHKDSGVLDDAADALKEKLKVIAGVSEVLDSSESGKREYVFDLKDEGYAAGLTPGYLGLQIRDAFYGREVDRLQRGSSEVKVMVRYPTAQRESRESLAKARILLPNGTRAGLDTVSEIKERYSPSTIKRVNGRRVISVTAATDEAVIVPETVFSMVDEDIMPDLQSRYPGLTYKVSGESEDQRNDMKMLAKNMAIALMIIFVMLASQLRSYAKPFVILMTVPIGIAGAIFGHMLLGFTLSFISMFGIVALTGVVINDSVVLVDYYNKLMHKKDARAFTCAIDAVQRRFRPILLTTLTTSLGLLPMLLEKSLQAQFIVPMAVSLACGIVFASVMLLLLVPCLLVIIEDFRALKDRLLGRNKISQAVPPPAE